MRSKPIGYGIVGAGSWGQSHIRIMTADPRVKVHAICDLDEKRAKAAAEMYGIPNYYTSVDTMLQNAEIEAVSVATPDFAHVEPALKVIQAKRHLLVEKPLATTVEECIQINQAVKKAGVTLMVDFHNRWNPPFYDAFQSIQSGGYGEIKYIYFRLNNVIFVPQNYISWSKKSSALWFLGPHAVDSVRWLFQDEVKEVFAVKRKGVLKGLGIDIPDFYVMTLQFEKGGVAVVENSWIVSNTALSPFDLKCEIQCSSGTFFIDTSHNRMLEKFPYQPNPMHISYPDLTNIPVIQDRPVGFGYESIRSFIDALWEGKPPKATGIDGLRCTEILIAAEESAEKNMPVKLKRNLCN